MCRLRIIFYFLPPCLSLYRKLLAAFFTSIYLWTMRSTEEAPGQNPLEITADSPCRKARRIMPRERAAGAALCSAGAALVQLPKEHKKLRCAPTRRAVTHPAMPGQLPSPLRFAARPGDPGRPAGRPGFLLAQWARPHSVRVLFQEPRRLGRPGYLLELRMQENTAAPMRTGTAV